MKRLLSIGLLSLFTLGCARAGITRVQIDWVHPDLKQKKTDSITDAKKSQELFDIFDGLDKAQNGTPWDTPFYDVVLTFTATGGETYQAKVYLPRFQIFPGMWKHPSGVLNYLEEEKEQPVRLVAILESLLPTDPIYPRTLPNPLPDVPFDRGIPNFRRAILPIRGDYRK